MFGGINGENCVSTPCIASGGFSWSLDVPGSTNEVTSKSDVGGWPELTNEAYPHLISSPTAKRSPFEVINGGMIIT